MSLLTAKAFREGEDGAAGTPQVNTHAHAQRKKTLHSPLNPWVASSCLPLRTVLLDHPVHQPLSLSHTHVRTCVPVLIR